jgi:proline dehydrogenase
MNLKFKEELTMKEIVKEINKYCNEYLGFVESVGNECAYTDSVIECIIKKAKELKEKYDEEV